MNIQIFIVSILNTGILQLLSYFLLKTRGTIELNKDEILKQTDFNGKIDDMFQDVMKYALEKELQVSVFPGKDDFPHLYALDDKTQKSYDLGELVSSLNKKGSTGYDFALQGYKDIIDAFIEKKDVLIQKEEKNDNK